MADTTTSLRELRAGLSPLPVDILGALAFPVVAVAGNGTVAYVNVAAEQFFGQGAGHLVGRSLDRIVAADSPVLSLVAQVRAAGSAISEYDLRLRLPRGGIRDLAVHAAPVAGDASDAGEVDESGFVILSLHERSATHSLQRQMANRNAARSVTAMASMLAHEIKNPLSGIRGAAQLLEQTASESDHQFTRLICEETDRICALVDRMSVFTDDQPAPREAVNIHEVLDRVQRIAQAGFAGGVRFSNDYDPSLPPVYGNRDLLIQVLLNLVKNAAEAVPRPGGEVHLGTMFRGGVRLAMPGGERRVQLPLVVSVTDNGPGIGDDVAQHMFDAFVTSKAGGTGLGLALAAKIIDDHGGMIEFDTKPGETSFRILLPMQDGPPHEDDGGP